MSICVQLHIQCVTVDIEDCPVKHRTNFAWHICIGTLGRSIWITSTRNIRSATGCRICGGFTGSPVLGDRNTGILVLCTILVYKFVPVLYTSNIPVLWFKKIYILLVYSIVVSIVIGIVEMLLLVLSIPDSTRIFMCVR